MFAKRSLNVFSMVAVSTSVPETNATPSTTAIAVSKKRILFAASPRRVTFHTGSLSEPAHLAEDRIGIRFAQLVDDAAVRKKHDTVGEGCRSRVVGDHHDRLFEV